MNDQMSAAEVLLGSLVGPSLQAYQGRILNYRRDGSAFWNQLTICPVRDWQGAITNFVSVQRDVTGDVAADLATAKQHEQGPLRG